MLYEQFVIMYPWFDFIMQLFVGIAPTIVAILAIVVNNQHAKKRDKINKIIDLKLQALYELEERVHKSHIEVSLLRVISPDESKEKFYEQYKKLLILQQQMENTASRCQILLEEKDAEWEKYYNVIEYTMKMTEKFFYDLTEEKQTLKYKELSHQISTDLQKAHDEYMKVLHEKIRSLVQNT